MFVRLSFELHVMRVTGKGRGDQTARLDRSCKYVDNVRKYACTHKLQNTHCEPLSLWVIGVDQQRH